VLEFEVSGERIQAVRMLPGYTHNIINLSETENLVTLMWATGAMAFGTTPQSSFS
jgi:UDP-2-acetamido-2,6-beta-L-arabino-hexul-4-ose reductase